MMKIKYYIYRLIQIIMCFCIMLTHASCYKLISKSVSGGKDGTGVIRGEELTVDIMDIGNLFPNSFRNEKTDRIVVEDINIEGIIYLNNKIIEMPITFINCTFKSPLYASSATFKDEIIFSNCTFNKVDFSDSIFQKDFIAHKCVFESNTTFRFANFGTKASFNCSKFKEDPNEVDFYGVNIKDVLQVTESEFDNSVDFSLLVAKRAFFDRTIFKGSVSFYQTTIEGDLGIRNAQFTNENQDDNFNSIIVGGFADFSGSTFSGTVRFVEAEFDSQVKFENVKFINNHPIHFDKMKIGSDLLLNGAIFSGPLTMMGTIIFRELQANNVIFKKSFNGNGMKTGGIAFENTTFENSVSFFSSELKRINILNTKFTDPNSTLSFMQTEFDTIIMHNTNAKCNVDFTLCTIRREFLCSECGFENHTQPVKFRLMEVNNNFILDSVSLNGGLEVAGTKVNNIMGIHKTKCIDPNEEVSFANIKAGNVSITYTTFNGPVTFANSTINQDFGLGDTRFLSHNNSVDFHGMQINGRYVLKNTIFEGPINLTNMIYSQIEIESNSEPFKEYMPLLNKTKYNSTLYLNFENYLKTRGSFKEAKQVYVEMRRRQRAECLYGFAKASNWLLDVTVLYGREPQRVLYPIASFIIIGSIVFRRSYMIARKQGTERISYFSFWYSLDLFLPVIQLHWANDWMPKQKHKYVRLWMIIHRLLGWLLIPFGLAAWMGIIQ